MIFFQCQIIIFHQPRFPWNKGIPLPKPLLGVRSCEVAIIWPELWHDLYTSIWDSTFRNTSEMRLVPIWPGPCQCEPMKRDTQTTTWNVLLNVSYLQDTATQAVSILFMNDTHLLCIHMNQSYISRNALCLETYCTVVNCINVIYYGTVCFLPIWFTSVLVQFSKDKPNWRHHDRKCIAKGVVCFIFALMFLLLFLWLFVSRFVCVCVCVIHFCLFSDFFPRVWGMLCFMGWVLIFLFWVWFTNMFNLLCSL